MASKKRDEVKQAAKVIEAQKGETAWVNVAALLKTMKAMRRQRAKRKGRK